MSYLIHYQTISYVSHDNIHLMQWGSLVRAKLFSIMIEGIRQELKVLLLLVSFLKYVAQKIYIGYMIMATFYTD